MSLMTKVTRCPLSPLSRLTRRCPTFSRTTELFCILSSVSQTALCPHCDWFNVLLTQQKPFTDTRLVFSDREDSSEDSQDRGCDWLVSIKLSPPGVSSRYMCHVFCCLKLHPAGEVLIKQHVSVNSYKNNKVGNVAHILPPLFWFALIVFFLLVC